MDNFQDQLNRAERRARRYWYEDGLAEILIGAVFLAVAAYFLAQGLLPAGTALSGLFALGFPVLLISLGLLARRWLAAAKDRYVHPRTGYVAFRRPHAHRWLTGVLGFIISCLLVMLITRAPALVTWLPALQGLVLGIAFLYIGRKVDTVRFPIAGVLCAIAGLLLSVLHLDENLATAALFGWLGSIMVAGGALAFRAYLRHAPPPEEA